MLDASLNSVFANGEHCQLVEREGRVYVEVGPVTAMRFDSVDMENIAIYGAGGSIADLCLESTGWVMYEAPNRGRTLFHTQSSVTAMRLATERLFRVWQ